MSARLQGRARAREGGRRLSGRGGERRPRAREAGGQMNATALRPAPASQRRPAHAPSGGRPPRARSGSSADFKSRSSSSNTRYKLPENETKTSNSSTMCACGARPAAAAAADAPAPPAAAATAAAAACEGGSEGGEGKRAARRGVAGGARLPRNPDLRGSARRTVARGESSFSAQISRSAVAGTPSVQASMRTCGGAARHGTGATGHACGAKGLASAHAQGSPRASPLRTFFSATSTPRWRSRAR
jgi:hypothetical protein